MASATSHDIVQPENGSATVQVRVDRILFLTGLLGAAWLLICWIFAVSVLFAVTAAAYFALIGDPSMAISAAIAGLILLLTCPFAWWLARCLLGRSRVRAAVACLAMSIVAGALVAWIAHEIDNGMMSWRDGVGLLFLSLSGVVAAALVVVSFGNRSYWTGKL